MTLLMMAETVSDMAADLGRCLCVCCRADFTVDGAQGQNVSKRVNERTRERRGKGSQT